MTIQELKTLAAGQVVQYKGMKIPSAHGGFLLNSPAGPATVRSAQEHNTTAFGKYFGVCIVLADGRECYLNDTDADDASLGYFSI